MTSQPALRAAAPPSPALVWALPAAASVTLPALTSSDFPIVPFLEGGCAHACSGLLRVDFISLFQKDLLSLISRFLNLSPCRLRAPNAGNT